MKKQKLIRALRNAEYRDTLSAEEMALLPDHPAGAVEIDESVLGDVAGATHTCDHDTCTGSTCDPPNSYNSCWTGGSFCCC